MNLSVNVNVELPDHAVLLGDGGMDAALADHLHNLLLGGRRVLQPDPAGHVRQGQGNKRLGQPAPH